jgi:hypothetical protein
VILDREPLITAQTTTASGGRLLSFKNAPMSLGGRAVESTQIGFFQEIKKRGVPRLHGNMLPGNSFPQICVVSIHMLWKFG